MLKSSQIQVTKIKQYPKYGEKKIYKGNEVIIMFL